MSRKPSPAPIAPIHPPTPSRQGPTSRRAFLKTNAASLGLIAGTLPLLPGPAHTAPDPRPPTPPLPPPTNATGSDVGNLFPFIERQAVTRDFPLSFLNPRFRSLTSWRRTARARFLDLLHYHPKPVRPDARLIARTERPDHTIESIEFNTTPDLRVPASVLIPANRPRPFPAIIALHDHGGFYFWGREKIIENDPEPPILEEFKRQYYGGKSIATELVRRGYLVVIIDMFYWGQRRMLLDEDPADWRERPASIPKERVQAFNARAGQSEQLVGRTLYASGITWPGILFWDDLRTVDYLVSRPDVDRHRVGCVGLSVGGLRSCHLAALDDRIQAAVVVGWMTSFPHQLRRHVRNTIGHTKVVPGLYRHMDYPDVAALAMPRPLLVMNGSRDGLFHPEGVRSSFEKLHACYAKAGIPDRCQTRLYDRPHEFNADMQHEAWDWLARWIPPG